MLLIAFPLIFMFIKVYIINKNINFKFKDNFMKNKLRSVIINFKSIVFFFEDIVDISRKNLINAVNEIFSFFFLNLFTQKEKRIKALFYWRISPFYYINAEPSSENIFLSRKRNFQGIWKRFDIKFFFSTLSEVLENCWLFQVSF